MERTQWRCKCPSLSNGQYLFFSSGERTFLSWMHAGIMLAGISMAMSAHTDTGSAGDWVALLLLPVAIGIMVYSMLQCKLCCRGATARSGNIVILVVHLASSSFSCIGGCWCYSFKAKLHGCYTIAGTLRRSLWTDRGRIRVCRFVAGSALCRVGSAVVRWRW